jgi:mannosyltransferase OCH1-like enzyme
MHEHAIATHGVSFPRLIHQIWLQGVDELPADLVELSRTWREVNGAWQHLMWDEASLCALIDAEFAEHASAWRALSPAIRRCDAARLFVLIAHGGLYADMDTRALQPLDVLVSRHALRGYDTVLALENHLATAWKGPVAKAIGEARSLDEVVGNAVMMSRQGSPFLKAFLEASFSRSGRHVLDSFSTWHLSEFVAHAAWRGEVRILAANVLLGQDPGDPAAFSTHRYDGSWLDTSLARPWEAR